jgi:hypothetical protein
MQRITITLDRVFDITTGSARGRHPCTFVNFQSGALSQFGIALPGSPGLRNGMTVTALLDKYDNWQTLLGWVDHETGEIVCWSRGQEVLFFAALVPISALLAYSSQEFPEISLAGLLLLASYSCFAIKEFRSLSVARRALDHIKTVELRF